MTNKTKTVGKTTNTIKKGGITMEQLQFKGVSRQSTDKEYLAERIQTTCELITEYINDRVSKSHEIKSTEVFKDFKDKEQLKALLVIGNYLDKKLDTIHEQEENDDNYITVDSAKVLEVFNTIIASRKGGE